jgi:uncharacterized membrane protein
MVGIVLIGMLVGSIAPFGILMGPMMCGIHLCIFALMRNEQVSFNLLFKGFDYFVQSLIATLVQIVPVMVLLVPAYVVFGIVMGIAAAAADNSDPGPEFVAAFAVGIGLFLLFVMLLAVAVGTFFMFTYQLIADRKLSGFDACKLSAKAALGNLGGALGLMILSGLLGIVGALFCYVGAILVMPISFAAFDVAYRQVFPSVAVGPSPYTPPPQYPDYGAHYPPQ